MEYALATPIITALVEVIKRLGVPSKFLPAIAVILGIRYSAFSNITFNFQTVVFGIIVGLSSVGLYEGVKPPITMGVNQVKKLM